MWTIPLRRRVHCAGVSGANKENTSCKTKTHHKMDERRKKIVCFYIYRTSKILRGFSHVTFSLATLAAAIIEDKQLHSNHYNIMFGVK